jgi:hypothetical protein
MHRGPNVAPLAVVAGVAVASVLVFGGTARARAQDRASSREAVGPYEGAESQQPGLQGPGSQAASASVARASEAPTGLAGGGDLPLDPTPPLPAAVAVAQVPRVGDQDDVEPAAPVEPQPEPPLTFRAELGQGLTVSSGEAFALQLRARIQFQTAFTHPAARAVEAGAEDATRIELLIRRFRIVLSGHVLTRDLRYYIQLGIAPRDMEPDLLVPLRDAYVTWQFHRDVGVRFGQMKVPYGQQRVVSSSALQMVDRSIVTSELNLDRDIGIYLLSEDLFGLGGVIQYQLGVFGGRGRNRFGGMDAAMFAGRIQVNPFGAFDHLVEGDFTRSMQPRLAIGASAAYNIDSNRGRSTHDNVLRVGRFDYLHLGADVHFKCAGFTLLSEIMFREADAPAATGTVDGNMVTEFSRSAWGWFAQVGYMTPIALEIVGRYGEIRPLEGNAPEARFFLQREAGGAISYYVHQHALKIQVDYFHLFGDDPRAERDQVRAQVQLFF